MKRSIKNTVTVPIHVTINQDCENTIYLIRMIELLVKAASERCGFRNKKYRVQLGHMAGGVRTGTIGMDNIGSSDWRGNVTATSVGRSTKVDIELTMRLKKNHIPYADMDYQGLDGKCILTVTIDRCYGNIGACDFISNIMIPNWARDFGIDDPDFKVEVEWFPIYATEEPGLDKDAYGRIKIHLNKKKSESVMGIYRVIVAVETITVVAVMELDHRIPKCKVLAEQLLNN